MTDIMMNTPGRARQSRQPIKVLFLSRNYPNNVIPLLGLWVDGLVRHLSALCEARVVAPVPYCPPFPRFMEQYTRFRRVPLQEHTNGIEVWHPRFLTGPGYALYSFESSTYYWGIRRQVDQLRQEFRFDLIHAFFSYPDGVVAARLGRRYSVPVLIAEQAPWQPFMEDYPRVRCQAVWASEVCAFHIAPSHYVRDTIAHFTGETDKLRIIPNGVDGSVFAPLPDGRKADPNQILFVGIIRHVKGVDILFKAMRQLINHLPALRLILVGGGFYRQQCRDEDRLRRLAGELGLGGHIEFVGMKAPSEVAEYMKESAMLVLPSRAESFGCVLVEALACGTPVVATRCGGPEDIVTDDVGVLVPPEDADALAKAIEHVLERRETYDPARLRTYALENYSWERIARRTVGLYDEAMDRFHKA